MKVGLISDIHGNLPALEAVLQEMPPVDTLVCLGDVVGYGPHPAECVESVRDKCDILLQGNHDRDIREPEKYATNNQAKAGLHYTQQELPDDEISYLSGLPEKVEIDEFVAVHSHPRDVDKYVMPRDFPRMRPLLDNHDGIFLGHTHIQHKAMIDGRLILNPGSVGQPRTGTEAEYAVVDTSILESKLYTTEYNIPRVVEAIRKAGLPIEIAKRLE